MRHIFKRFVIASFIRFINLIVLLFHPEKIGDIMLLGETGAQMVAEPELAGSIATALKNIKTVPVIVERIELSELRLKQSVTKVLTSIEASMRLDAIASAGFGLSRSKMVKLIESGNVHVNWVETLSPAQKLQVRNWLPRLYQLRTPYLLL